MKKWYVAIIVIALSPSISHAACVSPAGEAGDQIYNSSHNVMQYCNGTDWIAMGSSGGGGADGDTLGELSCGNGDSIQYNGTAWTCVPGKVSRSGDTMTGNLTVPAPTAAGHATTKQYVDAATSGGGHTGGYLVSVQTGHVSGNLGGLAGVNAICLSTLTGINWWNGRVSAQARGLLNATNVKAWLCDSSGCQNMTPSTAYKLSVVSGQGQMSDYTFTTTAGGLPPDDNIHWASVGTVASGTYLTGRNASGTHTGAFNCNNWADLGATATVANGGGSPISNKFNTFTDACNTPKRWFCMVNP